MSWIWRRLTKRAPREFADPLPPSLAPPVGKVSRFLLEHITPAKGAETPIDTLAKSYAPWCRERGYQPLGSKVMLEEMAGLFERAGVKIKVEKGRLYAIDVDMI